MNNLTNEGINKNNKVRSSIRLHIYLNITYLTIEKNVNDRVPKARASNEMKKISIGTVIWRWNYYISALDKVLDSRWVFITHHFVKMNPGTVQAGDKKFKLTNLKKQTSAYGVHDMLYAKIIRKTILSTFLCRLDLIWAILPSRFCPSWNWKPFELFWYSRYFLIILCKFPDIH